LIRNTHMYKVRISLLSIANKFTNLVHRYLPDKFYLYLPSGGLNGWILCCVFCL
jgi:hypothetical protein